MDDKIGNKHIIKSRSYPTPSSIDKLQRRRRRNIIIISIVLIVLLTVTYLQIHYLESPSAGIFAVFNLNITLLILLIFLIFRNLFKLIIERKRKKMGSRFRTRLVFAFVVLSMLPTGLLALIGSNLMADSIRNWFNPQIEHFLDDVMNVARFAYSDTEDLTKHYAQNISHIITSESLLDLSQRDKLEKQLQQKLSEYQLSMIQVFNYKGTEVWRGNKQEFPPGVFSSQSEILESVLKGDELFSTSLLGNGELFQYSIPIYAGPPKINGVLMVTYFKPKGITQKIRSIQRNYEAFKQQKQSIRPTQALYISIFVMIALTILFAAIWLGMYIARQIAIPISHLAQGTEEISKGNLDFKLEIMAYDELGTLVDSFNKMTYQLKANRSLIEKTTKELRSTNQEIIRRRNQLETLLQNVSAGVISLDQYGIIIIVNQAVCRLLNLSSKNVLGKNYESVLSAEYLTEFRRFFSRALTARSRAFHREIEVKKGRQVMTCSVSAAPILDENSLFTGIVVVIDDLTQFLRMQRIAAWRDIARRLAHEIKNPLTPIQLNTQRLQKKFENNAPDLPQVFEEATRVIIKEVNDLRMMLDEFSKFARMPEPDPQLKDLHTIIEEVHALYKGIDENVKIVLDFDNKIPEIMIDSEQIKRVFINLLDNALEAISGKGLIKIKTELNQYDQMVRIMIEDNGPGISIRNQDKLFLPYYSTKGRGSGLGLAICNRIVSDHGGFIKAVDNVPTGTKFIIELPISENPQENSP